MQAMPKRLAPAEPESWCTRTTDTDVAVLTVPGALDRTRTFDVDVLLRVGVPVAARQPELGLSLEVDGALRWSRSMTSRMTGDVDTLEYHCRLVLEPGRDCRLRARAALRHCALMSLSLSAAESGAPVP
jgi:hypothetical protein